MPVGPQRRSCLLWVTSRLKTVRHLRKLQGSLCNSCFIFSSCSCLKAERSIPTSIRQAKRLHRSRKTELFYFCARGSGTLTFPHFVSVTFIYSRAIIDVPVFRRGFSCAGLRAGFWDESHFAIECSSSKPKCHILALKAWGKLGFKVGSELSDCSVSEFIFPCSWM